MLENKHNLQFVKPEVVVVSTMDNRSVAWAESRNNQYADMTEWTNKDFAIHDMMQVGLNFKFASIGFRELLMILRPYNSWARSTREHHPKAQKLIDLGYSDEVKQKIIDQMNLAIEEVDRTDLDNGRLKYPLAVSAGFFYQTSYRLLMMFIKTLEKFYPKYYEYYGIPILRGLDISDEKFQLLEYKPLDDAYSLSKDSLAEEHTSKLVGDFAYVRTKVPFSLVSQLVRQRQAKVLSNYYQLVKEWGEDRIESEMLQDQDIEIAIMTSQEHYEKMAKYRSCYVFSRHLWEPLLTAWYKKNKDNDTLRNMYPCDCDPSKCFTAPEVRAAENGEFGYYPCPVFMQSQYSLTKYVESHGNLKSYQIDKILLNDELKLPIGPTERDLKSEEMRETGGYAKSKL